MGTRRSGKHSSKRGQATPVIAPFTDALQTTATVPSTWGAARDKTGNRRVADSAPALRKRDTNRLDASLAKLLGRDLLEWEKSSLAKRRVLSALDSLQDILESPQISNRIQTIMTEISRNGKHELLENEFEIVQCHALRLAGYAAYLTHPKSRSDIGIYFERDNVWMGIQNKSTRNYKERLSFELCSAQDPVSDYRKRSGIDVNLQDAGASNRGEIEKLIYSCIIQQFNSYAGISFSERTSKAHAAVDHYSLLGVDTPQMCSVMNACFMAREWKRHHGIKGANPLVLSHSPGKRGVASWTLAFNWDGVPDEIRQRPEFRDVTGGSFNIGIDGHPPHALRVRQLERDGLVYDCGGIEVDGPSFTGGEYAADTDAEMEPLDPVAAARTALGLTE